MQQLVAKIFCIVREDLMEETSEEDTFFKEELGELLLVQPLHGGGYANDLPCGPVSMARVGALHW